MPNTTASIRKTSVPAKIGLPDPRVTNAKPASGPNWSSSSKSGRQVWQRETWRATSQPAIHSARPIIRETGIARLSGLLARKRNGGRARRRGMGKFRRQLLRRRGVADRHHREARLPRPSIDELAHG